MQPLLAMLVASFLPLAHTETTISFSCCVSNRKLTSSLTSNSQSSSYRIGDCINQGVASNFEGQACHQVCIEGGGCRDQLWMSECAWIGVKEKYSPSLPVPFL